MASFDGDPDHPILRQPFLWELVEFTYRRDLLNWQESYIDLLFVKDGEQRRLRFFAPRDVELSRGLLNSSGLCILDVTSRQLDGLGVRVASFEAMSDGTPSFWAAKVVEVTQ